MNYIIKYNPVTGLPYETAKYTFWKLSEFLGSEYLEDEWEGVVGKRPNRNRSILLYALHKIVLEETDRKEKLVQTYRKYKARQPKFWERFLRERYPAATIGDYFSVPHDDTKDEYLHYEAFMEEAGENPNETGRVFDPMPHFANIKRLVSKLAEQMDMNKAIEPKKAV